jgi:hypothetical protein
VFLCLYLTRAQTATQFWIWLQFLQKLKSSAARADINRIPDFRSNQGGSAMTLPGKKLPTVCVLLLGLLVLTASNPGFDWLTPAWATSSVKKLQKKMNRTARKAGKTLQKAGGQVARGLAAVAGSFALECSAEDDNPPESDAISLDVSFGPANHCGAGKTIAPPAPPAASPRHPPAPATQVHHQPSAAAVKK